MILFAATEKISTQAVWIGGIAVVLAAAITLIGVYLQTTKTLKAEGERLDDQLKAEKERLQLQLAHDRATHERAELRAILDAASTSMDELAYVAIEAMSDAEVFAQQTEAENRVKAEGDLDAKLDEFFAHIRKIDGHVSRLGMRLGAENDVRVSYREARDLLSSLHDSLLAREIDESDQEIWGKAGEKFKTFEKRASALIGTELEP